MMHLDFISDGDNFITSQDLQFRVIGDRVIDIDSISVTFYQSMSDPKTIGKQLRETAIMHGTLRNGTSFLNPVLVVNSGTPFFWNYAFIESMQRYYFITDVKAINKNLYEVYLKCDVLETYKDGIRSVRTKVARSESVANWNITDSLIPPNAKSTVKSYTATRLANTFKYPDVNKTLPYIDNFYNHISFKVACSALNLGSAIEYVPLGYVWCTASVNGFKKFLSALYDSGYFGGQYKITDVILDAKFVPVPSPASAGGYRWVEEIIFDNLKMTMYNHVYVGDMGQSDFRVGQSVLTTQQIATWQFQGITRESVLYRNHPPYRSMSVTFNPFGTVEIDSGVWGDRSNINIGVSVDTMTGDAVLYLFDGTYKEPIANCNVAIPIDISYVAKDGRDIANVLLGGLSSLARGDVASAVFGSMAETAFITPKFANVSGSGQAGANAQNAPVLLVKQVKQDNPHIQTQGWLCNQILLLRDLSGYAKIESGVHLDSSYFRYATRSEIDEIESLLTSGVVFS